MKEADRRRIEGLSPLHGDSCLNTPALATNSDLDGSSPTIVGIGDIDRSRASLMKNGVINFPAFRNYCTGLRSSRRKRWHGRRIPTNGNFPDYYSRRDANDRIEILMPDWFSKRSVADYGCHDGTVTFKVLERFPDVNNIDAFDCDSVLIEKAKRTQRQKIRFSTSSDPDFQKINFQVADWTYCASTEDLPSYDLILAFSVTKWIHLNYGDDGLVRFFRRVYNLLIPGGHFLLEPQPKTSYRKSRFTVCIKFILTLFILD